MLALIISIVILILACYWLYIKLFKKRYTRERYAFYATGLSFSLVIFIIPYLFGENIFLLAINYLCNLFNAQPIPTYPLTIFDKIIAIILVSIFINHINKTFKCWNGNISNRHYQLKQNHTTTNIISEAKFYIRNRNNNEIQVYNPNKNNERDNLFSTSMQSIIPWQNQVAELLNLSSREYNINVHKDWIEKERCFLSRYGKNNELIAIYCPADRKPADAKVKQFINYIQKENKNEKKQYVIAIRNSDIDETYKIDNIPVRYLGENRMINTLKQKFEFYFDDLKHNYENKEIIEGYNFTLSDTYTEPQCIINADEKKETISSIEDYIIEWLNDKHTNKQLAILGEYGQGKSVLSQRIAYKIINNPQITDRIPIIVELRGKFPKSFSSIMSFFSDICSNYSIDAKTLQKLHQYGKLLIIFEGFDEMELVGDYMIRLEHFKKIWRCCLPNSKIIITGRPNYFLNKTEMNTFLKIKKEQYTAQYCEEIHIQKFGVKEIVNSLRHFSLDIKDEIVNIYNNTQNTSFKDLISRPSSLFLTGIIWKEQRISEMKDNLNSSIIINKFIEHSYTRQERKNHETPLSNAERAYFMQGIAVYMMQKSGYTNRISQRDLEECILKLLNKYPDIISRNDVNSPTIKLKNRYDKRYFNDTILLDIRSCGILVMDLSSFDSLMFAHKSFMELLISNYIVDSILHNNKEDNSIAAIRYRSIKEALNLDNENVYKTPEVFKFISEQCTLSIKFDEEISDKEKIYKIFQSLHCSRLSAQWYFKMMHYTGRFPILGLASILILCISFVLFIYRTVIIIINTDGVKTTDNYMNSIFSFILLAFSIHLYMIVVKDSKIGLNLFLGYGKLINTLIYYLSNNTRHKGFYLYDKNNMLLFFSLCKNNHLLDTLKEMIPEKYFYKLKNNLKEMEDFTSKYSN